MKLAKVLIWVSLLLLLTSFGTCYFGVSYEVSKIPIEVREGMADTDWVGIEWIAGGTVIFFVSAITAIASLIIYLVQRRRRQKSTSAP